MDNILFVLIDSSPISFFKRYQQNLLSIHKELLNKLSNYDTLILGNENSNISSNKFNNSKEMYKFIAQSSKGRDIIIIDAFAGFCSLKDTEKLINYCRKNLYDVCFTENIPQGIIPEVITSSFIEDFVSYLDNNKIISSSVKNLIDWEYQGIDVGVYLSPSLLIMERVDFLPTNKMSVEYIQKHSSQHDLDLESITELVKQNSFFLRNYPQYIAIELSSLSDNFYSAPFQYPDMDIKLLRKIITEIDELCPEALISIGVWGEPFSHQQFTEVIKILNTISNPMLIESRGAFLSEEYIKLCLSRKNTECIIDVSFTTEETFKVYKDTPYSLQYVKNFLKTKTSPNLWVKLTRSKETEPHIKDFLHDWRDFMPRVLINKADSFGKDNNKVVDLAPIKRHTCYALRRELTILNNGDVLLCRQSNDVIGTLQKESLQCIWNKNQQAYQQQLNNQFNNCSECQLCDDWWIWN